MLTEKVLIHFDPKLRILSTALPADADAPGRRPDCVLGHNSYGRHFCAPYTNHNDDSEHRRVPHWHGSRLEAG